MMRDETQSVAVVVTDAMMKMLKQPVLNTFLIAFNQHESPAENQNSANPFFGLFTLTDWLERDARRLETVTPKRKAEEPPEGSVKVEKADPELEGCIAKAIADMKPVLHPDQEFVIDSESVKALFKSARETNYKLRKAEALKRWKEAERKRMKIERIRAMLSRPRSHQHA